MNFPTRVALVPLLLLVMTGCSTPADAPEGPATIASDGAPEEFTTREVLPSCGVLELEQGESIPQSAVDCMTDAAGTGGAELAVTAPTTEGDPFVQYFRTTNAGLEIWTDSTKDRFGSGEWSLMTCPDATSIVETGDCA